MKRLGRNKGKNKNKNENLQNVFTRETLGVVLILFATLCMVCLITRDAVFSEPGKYVNQFLLGCFGVFAYAVDISVFILGVLLVFDKKTGLSFKRKSLITLFFILTALVAHVISMRGKNLEFSEYIITSYKMAEGGLKTASGGGFFTALIAQPVSKLLTDAGCYVVAGICMAVIAYCLVKDFMGDTKASRVQTVNKFRGSFVKDDEKTAQSDGNPQPEYVTNGDSVQSENKQRLFINNPQSFAFKNKKEINNDANYSGLKIGYAENGLGVVSSHVQQNQPSIENYKQKLDYVKTPLVPNIETVKNNGMPVQKPYYSKPEPNENSFVKGETTISDYVNQVKPQVSEVTPQVQEEIPFIEHESGVTVSGDSVIERSNTYDRLYAQAPEVKDEPIAPVSDDVVFRAVREGRIEEIQEIESSNNQEVVDQDIPFVEESLVKEESVEPEPIIEQPPVQSTISTDRRIKDILGEGRGVEQEKTENEQSLGFTSRVSADNNLSSRRIISERPAPIEPEKPKKEQPPINRKYYRPPLDLLEKYTPPVDAPKENHEERMEIIQKTLEEFHINAVPQSYVHGPSITRYEVMMPAGVSVKKVLAYDDDLKMRLAAKDGVRIEAPIPGKNLVGIEVANSIKTTVGLREILEAYAAQNNKEGALMFALGKDLVGKPILDDLSKGPHYLVAGATGSGKSVCLNLMIVSLIMRYSPEDLRLILVDPKGVEFINYEHIPHLMIDEIITEPKKALAVLSWAYNEMERRFAVFRENGGGLVVNIDDYNSVVASDTVAKMPRIVIIIDELADLMETCKKDLESRIRAIAQKARAAGIHLVLATQRPSVDIITGTIKANLPSRIAFKVMNFNDSQTILSEAGAEKLLGNGDMLYKNTRMSSVERYQGAYICGREVNNIVGYIKEKNKAYFDDELKEFLDRETRPKQEESVSDGGDNGGGSDPNEVDQFFLKALWLAVNTETVSISQLQRRFQIGYSRAGGLVDKMERMGFVSANEGSKARRVLLSREQFEERFGPMAE